MSRFTVQAERTAIPREESASVTLFAAPVTVPTGGFSRLFSCVPDLLDDVTVRLVFCADQIDLL